MGHIARHAARDYNDTVVTIREAATAHNIDTIMSVVECGYGSTSSVRRDITNSNVSKLQLIAESSYSARGTGTPLFDSIGDLIEQFESLSDANASRRYSGANLAEKIKQLQSTDRWTFVFRVPRGDARTLIKLGIPEHNILEWDQHQRGVETATASTKQAFNEFYTSRASGAKSTTKFYANLAEVTIADVEAKLVDISKDVTLFPVSKSEDGSQIRAFCEGRLGGKAFVKGAAFYQLTKPETVQDYKLIAIRSKTTNAIHSGAAARDLLGLPRYGEIKLTPDKLGDFNVFVQSTSVNRKVSTGTQVLYWEHFTS
jgi:hypothetical protein